MKNVPCFWASLVRKQCISKSGLFRPHVLSVALNSTAVPIGPPVSLPCFSLFTPQAGLSSGRFFFGVTIDGAVEPDNSCELH